MLLHSSSKKEKNPPTCPDFDQARGFFAHFAIMNRRTGRGAEPEPRPQAGGRGGAGPRPERTERREAGPRPQAGGKGDARPGLGHRPAGKATRSQASAGTRARKRTPPPPAPEGPSARERKTGAGTKRRTAPDTNCQPPATSRGWIAAVLAGQLLAQLLERPAPAGRASASEGPPETLTNIGRKTVAADSASIGRKVVAIGSAGIGRGNTASLRVFGKGFQHATNVDGL